MLTLRSFLNIRKRGIRRGKMAILKYIGPYLLAVWVSGSYDHLAMLGIFAVLKITRKRHITDS